MAIPLRQSTASQEVLLGPFLDSTDGNTTETALTIANTDIKVFKRGASASVNKNSGGASHVASGRYLATLDATDTDTLGELVIYVHVSGALAVRHECIVFPVNIFDSLFLGTDLIDASVAQWAGAAVATPTTAGLPEVDVTHVSGTLLASPLATEDYIDDATDTIVTTVDGNTQTALDALETHGDANWSSGSIPGGTVPNNGSTATTLKLAGDDIVSGAGDDDVYMGWLVRLVSGTGRGDVQTVIGYTAADGTVTVSPGWRFATPDTTTVYQILPDQALSGEQVTDLIDAAIVAAGLATSADQATLLSNLATVDGLVDQLIAALVSNLAEATAPPAANAPLRDKWNWLFTQSVGAMDQTASANSIKDSGGNVVATRTISDNGTTATKGRVTAA